MGQTISEGAVHVAPDETSRVYSRVKRYQYLVINTTDSEAWLSVVMSNGSTGYIRSTIVVRLPRTVTVNQAQSVNDVPLSDRRRKRISPIDEIPLGYVVGRYRTESREISQFLPGASEDEINLFGTKLELRSNKTFTAMIGSTSFGGTFTFNGKAKRLILVVDTVNGKKDKSPENWLATILTDGIRKYLLIDEHELWLEKVSSSK